MPIKEGGHYLGFGGHNFNMKFSTKNLKKTWLSVIAISIVAFLTAGCSSSSSSISSDQVNPLGAYQQTDPKGGLATDGTTKTPGAIDQPIISLPPDGQVIDGHLNAPLLDNMHPGWQQSDCLTCHEHTTRNPDHYYTDSSLCYLCHGTNGLPGFKDDIPPVISGVVAQPTSNSVVITWRTDKECLSRVIIRTRQGDRIEFPVSMDFKESHRYEVRGLQPSTAYQFEVISTDRSGNRTTSATFGTLSFTTEPQN